MRTLKVIVKNVSAELSSFSWKEWPCLKRRHFSNLLFCFVFFFFKSQAQEPAPAAAPPPEAGDLGGRGRQKGAPGPFSAEGAVKQKVELHFFC